ETQQRANAFEHSVAVFVGQAIQSRTIFALAGYIHFAVESQNALNVFDFLAIRANAIRNLVAIRVVNEQEAAAFFRIEDVAKLIEGHGDERTRLIATENLLHLKLRIDLEALALRNLLRGHIFAAIPGSGAAQRAEDLGRQPTAVVIDSRIPQRQR